MNGRVLFTGFRKDIHGVLADTDILVLPSSEEGLPTVVLEALAMKRPVIASDVCGTHEAVKNGFNGFLIRSPVDVAELCDKLRVLLSNSELRSQMGENGRRFVQDRFNIEDNIRAYEKVFLNAVLSPSRS